MSTTVAEIRAMLDAAGPDEIDAIERSLAADTRKGVRAAIAQARKRIDAAKAEQARVHALFDFDLAHLPEGAAGPVVGLDEVGRGAVAGPLAVGAVVFPSECFIQNLNDSKQLTPEQRQAVSATVKEAALAWAVVYVKPEDIDRDGMTASLRRAFKQALAQVESAGIDPSVVLLDGNPLGMDAREVNVVKGDSKSASIAAASVVAKVERDQLMCDLSQEFPCYGFDSNKGYGSEKHIQAIRTYGLTPVHRKSFCKSFMQETLF